MTGVNEVAIFAAQACGTNSVTTGMGGNIWYVAPYQQIWYQQQQVQQVVITTAGDSIQTVAWPYYSYGTGGMPMIASCQTVTTSFPETDEQRLDRERREAEYKAKEDAATKRAEEMLFLLLNDEQRKQYEDYGYFETKVDDRLYRINKGRAMNVELIEGGVAKFKYCALPKDYMPAPDVMAAQLLMLQTDEKRFLSIANRTGLHAPETTPVAQEINVDMGLVPFPSVYVGVV
jgi:hypothetical protein